MTPAARALAFAGLLLATPAQAGPPFLTDDPEPTETGHWEIYAPLADVTGTGGAIDGSFGAEINFGAARDVQLTLGVPVSVSHDGAAWRVGRGDLEASVKYRFHHDAHGVSIAVFPGLTLPTGSGQGPRRVTALLPVWAQKDMGAWSVFGGGGYAINPGAGRRDYWTAGAALARQLSERLLIGVEADRQGADASDSRAATSIGIGAIRGIGGPFRLLASGGPTFVDGQHALAFHGFVALGIDL